MLSLNDIVAVRCVRKFTEAFFLAVFFIVVGFQAQLKLLSNGNFFFSFILNNFCYFNAHLLFSGQT